MATGEGLATKSSVHYRFMADISERCGNCAMFKDWHCTAVQGLIIPIMVCDLWEGRKNEQEATAPA
jgi:hypothetical protein